MKSDSKSTVFILIGKHFGRCNSKTIFLCLWSSFLRVFKQKNKEKEEKLQEITCMDMFQNVQSFIPMATYHFISTKSDWQPMTNETKLLRFATDQFKFAVLFACNAKRAGRVWSFGIRTDTTAVRLDLYGRINLNIHIYYLKAGD